MCNSCSVAEIRSLPYHARVRNQEISKAVLRRLCDGDVAALDELFDVYGERVFRVCLGILGNHADAEDAAQEVFLKVFRQASKFSGRSQFSVWLLRLTSNHALNLAKAARRRKGRGVALCDELVLEAPSPEQVAMGRERDAKVVALLQQLPEEQRQVVVLRELEGLNYSELAEVLGLRVGTVASRLVRGREKLRELLKESGLEDQSTG